MTDSAAATDGRTWQQPGHKLSRAAARVASWLITLPAICPLSGSGSASRKP